MSFAADLDESPAWGPEPAGEDIVTSAIKKEKVLKYVTSPPYRSARAHLCCREIVASQEDLRCLYSDSAL